MESTVSNIDSCFDKKTLAVIRNIFIIIQCTRKMFETSLSFAGGGGGENGERKGNSHRRPHGREKNRPGGRISSGIRTICHLLLLVFNGAILPLPFLCHKGGRGCFFCKMEKASKLD